MRPTETEPVQTVRSEGMGSLPPRVLVVDDEEWMRDACAEILQPQGFQVMRASDGRTGLDLLKRHSPDLILVDLKMPGMDGLAYLESVKALDPDIAAIMISGYATLELAVEAMKAGACDFLPKPFKPEQLRSVARRGLEHRVAAKRFSAIVRSEAPAAEELHLAMLAHRFKAPLSAMLQCAWVVLQGYAGDMSPGVKSMIELLAQRADQMMRFVNDWLTLARLDQGTTVIHLQQIDLAEIANSVIDRVREDARARKITVVAEVARRPEPHQADAGLVEEMIGNLVDNAVRYTPAGGTVTVRVDAPEEGAEVSVRDTGPGISPEDLDRIFEPFYRGHAQKNVPGTGLGLPIVKRIAESLGGRVEVHTVAGRGSEFRVLLRRANAHEVRPARANPGEGRDLP